MVHIFILDTKSFLHLVKDVYFYPMKNYDLFIHSVAEWKLTLPQADLKRPNDVAWGVNDRTVGSAEEDQTARMCSLILIYTLRIIII